MSDTTSAVQEPILATEAQRGARLARGALFNLLAFMASNFRGIFTFLIARLLGSAALGTFGVAWAATDLVSKFSTFGFETSVVAYVARSEAAGDRAMSRRIIRTALLIGLALSVVLGGLGFWVMPLVATRLGVRPEVARMTGLLLLALPGVTLYRISNAASRGMSVMHHDIWSRGFTDSFASAAALLIAIAVGARASAPAIAAIAGTLASGCVAFVLARGVSAGSSARGAAAGARPAAFLADSAAIAAHDFVNIGIMRIDVIMLGWFVGRAPGVTLVTLGIYAAAVEVGGGARKINQAFNPIFTPVVARLMRSGRIEEAQDTFAYVGRWMLAVLLPMVVVMTLAGSLILSLYGPAFVAGGTWLAVIALACALNAFVGLGETILMVERPRVNLVNSVVALVMTLVANALLIPALGPLGAALGMLIPYAAYGVLRGFEISWLFGWRWPWPALGKPFLITAQALIVALPVRLLLPSRWAEAGAGVCFIVSYLGAWRLFRLDPSDQAVIDHLLGRQ